MKPRHDTETARRERDARLHAGVLTKLAMCIGLLAYLAETWARPNRPAMLAVTLGACLIAFVVTRIPESRLRRHIAADPSLVGWNLLSILLLAVLVALDGDPHSPLAFTFAVPMVRAGLSFPPRTVAVSAGAALAACAGALLAAGSFDAPFVTLLAVTLISVGLGCAWQARLHQRTLLHLARLSRTDELTGCLNRRGFVEQLAARLERHARHDASFGLVLIDLDDFKAVNDEYGHAEGDALLRRTAMSLSGTIRGTDVVARLGGDEFAVLLEETDTITAELVAVRLRSAVLRHSGASVGYASCPEDGTDAEALYSRADARLYAAKRDGAPPRTPLSVA